MFKEKCQIKIKNMNLNKKNPKKGFIKNLTKSFANHLMKGFIENPMIRAQNIQFKKK